MCEAKAAASEAWLRSAEIIPRPDFPRAVAVSCEYGNQKTLDVLPISIAGHRCPAEEKRKYIAASNPMQRSIARKTWCSEISAFLAQCLAITWRNQPPVPMIIFVGHQWFAILDSSHGNHMGVLRSWESPVWECPQYLTMTPTHGDSAPSQAWAWSDLKGNPVQQQGAKCWRLAELLLTRQSWQIANQLTH